MPTALQCFLDQDYGNRELLVVEDGHEDARAVLPHDPRIRYVRLPRRFHIGEKRNLCCMLAKGQIIAHWDDDDWSYPGRLSEQVAVLQAGAPLTGYRTVYFYDPRTRLAHLYSGAWWYAVGTSLCYWRRWWEQNRFRHFQCGEDNDFVQRARQVSRPIEGIGKMVALSHGDGTSSDRMLNTKQWRPVDPEVLPWRPRE